jgi:hypothetical protein
MSIGPTPPLRPPSHSVLNPNSPHPTSPNSGSPNQNTQNQNTQNQAPLSQAIAAHAPRPTDTPATTRSDSGTNRLPAGQDADAGPAESEQASADRHGDGRLAWQLETWPESDCQISDEKLQQDNRLNESRGRQLDLEG